MIIVLSFAWAVLDIYVRLFSFFWIKFPEHTSTYGVRGTLMLLYFLWRISLSINMFEIARRYEFDRISSATSWAWNFLGVHTRCLYNTQIHPTLFFNLLFLDVSLLSSAESLVFDFFYSKTWDLETFLFLIESCLFLRARIFCCSYFITCWVGPGQVDMKTHIGISNNDGCGSRVCGCGINIGLDTKPNRPLSIGLDR